MTAVSVPHRRPGSRSRRHLRSRAGVAVVLVALTLGACVPAVTDRPTPSATSPAAAASASARPSFVRPTPTPQPTPLTWIVRTGETLTSIAKANRTTARSIAYWNRDRYPSLDPDSAGYAPDRIGVGWRLAIIPGAVVDETSLPSSPPSAVPGSSASASASVPAVAGNVVLSHGSRGSRQVALTFDLDGRLDPAAAIVDWLIAHRVKATVFATGTVATTTPEGRAVLERLRAHPDLFDVGNGTWDGRPLTGLEARAIADELTRAEAALAPLVARSTTPWFRPPGGAWDDRVREAVGRAGWSYTVTWEIDTLDTESTSEGGPTADDIVTQVVSQAEGGSIVALNLGGWNTLDALPGLVAGLEDRALVPSTLSELVRSAP